MKLGKHLRKFRLEKGYSQEYLAYVIGVSQKTYSNMENDKSPTSFETTQKLIQFYEIDVASLDIQKFLANGEIERFDHDQYNKGNSVMDVSVSMKLIEQMEERIVELKMQNLDLKNRLGRYEN